MSDANSPNNSTGWIPAVFGAIGSHVEERLRSPFVGAFAASWLVINWKPVLIIFGSERPMESRVEVVSSIYFSVWSTLWWPLIWSFMALLGFYVLTSVYLVASEFYWVLRRWIERKFDEVRWVPPSEYIQRKRENAKRISDLEQLASDKIEQINASEERARAANLNAETASADVDSIRSQLEDAVGLAGRMQARHDDIQAERASLKEIIKNLRNQLNATNQLLRESAVALNESDSIEVDLSRRGLRGLADYDSSDARTKHSDLIHRLDQATAFDISNDARMFKDK